MLKNTLSSRCPDELLAAAETLSTMRLAGGTGNAVMPYLRVHCLGQNNPADLSEVWTIVDGDIEAGTSGECDWRRGKELQIVSISDDLASDGQIEEAAYNSYRQLLRFIVESPHPELVRFWNYVPNINHGAGDAENYKRFCNGRLQAFSEAGISDIQFPAASAVGHYEQGLTVLALTAAASAKHHANPRQVDAFKYPRQYGPSSPSFARATTLQLRDQRLCFISGTASILGHSSVHRGDLKLQLYTTNDNILYLLNETGFKRNQVAGLRVYLRDQDDFLACQQVVEDLFPDTPAIYLHADICRSDLLVEIECFCISD